MLRFRDISRWRSGTRGHALTVNGSASNQVTNPLLRIASQAMADMQRIGTQFGLTPAVGAAQAQRRQANAFAVEVRRALLK
jgi:phage terminase small subunit